MKKAFYIVAIVLLFASCETNKSCNVRIVGKWKSGAWLEILEPAADDADAETICDKYKNDPRFMDIVCHHQCD